MHKTNALRMLDKAKIRYRTEEYPVDEKIFPVNMF